MVSTSTGEQQVDDLVGDHVMVGEDTNVIAGEPGRHQRRRGLGHDPHDRGLPGQLLVLLGRDRVGQRGLDGVEHGGWPRRPEAGTFERGEVSLHRRAAGAECPGEVRGPGRQFQGAPRQPAGRPELALQGPVPARQGPHPAAGARLGDLLVHTQQHRAATAPAGGISGPRVAGQDQEHQYAR
jgi:hypothetical protein